MGWATDALKGLRAGRPAHVREDDVVLVAWKGNHLLHLVKEAAPDQLLIGNNLGKIDGWCPVRRHGQSHASSRCGRWQAGG